MKDSSLLISVSDLCVSFGARRILKSVSLEARAGAITVIAGPNGSGKTTLLRAMSGEIDYDGAVAINGENLGHLKPWQIAKTRAVLPQETNLAFPFSVREVVRMGITAGGGTVDKSALDQRIEEALTRVDLPGFAGRYYQELSGGERQRVQLARVLCQIWHPVTADGPRWLFLDEPVSSLDIRHQLSIMDLAHRFAMEGGGVVTILHDLNLAAMYGQKIILMSDGYKRADGIADDVLEDGVLESVYNCGLKVGKIPTNAKFVLPQSAS